ncbi:hypothetical protein [Streptomyces sp. NBC_00197]|uniref:hypothetical protein n=1 Tax=Streptomyces sp. NBC_00197 TaxID=2975676 RepID=UPI00324CB34D
MKQRLDYLERAPSPDTNYDTYPTVEWAAVSRQATGGNVWSSCGIANVSGPGFDRVEVKFITDRVIPARSESEIRLAAFRHSAESGEKTCIAASSTFRLTGNYGVSGTTSGIGIGKIRWVHGIPIGWDADEDGVGSIYTVELQHRNPNDCPMTGDSSWDGAYKVSNMLYCVGMPTEQLPDASPSGWFWYEGGNTEVVRQPDITEVDMGI